MQLQVGIAAVKEYFTLGNILLNNQGHRYIYWTTEPDTDPTMIGNPIRPGEFHLIENFEGDLFFKGVVGFQELIITRLQPGVGFRRY